MSFSGVVYLVIGMLLIYSCYTDVVNRKISNRVSLSVMALSLVLMVFDHGEWSVLIISLLVLVVGF